MDKNPPHKEENKEPIITIIRSGEATYRITETQIARIIGEEKAAEQIVLALDKLFPESEEAANCKRLKGTTLVSIAIRKKSEIKQILQTLKKMGFVVASPRTHDEILIVITIINILLFIFHSIPRWLF